MPTVATGNLALKEKIMASISPRNTALLQGEAREIGAALGLSLRSQPQAATAR